MLTSDVTVIVLLIAIFCALAAISFVADRRAARRQKPPTTVCAVVGIPHVSSADGRPVHPETLHAVSLLVACEVSRQAHLMHHAVMEAVVAQVAADEAARVDLDDLLREAS